MDEDYIKSQIRNRYQITDEEMLENATCRAMYFLKRIRDRDIKN
jgi:hypothetical protein